MSKKRLASQEETGQEETGTGNPVDVTEVGEQAATKTLKNSSNMILIKLVAQRCNNI